MPPLFLAPFSSSVSVRIVIAYDDTFSTLESYLPLEEDFRGANLALARLQKTYNIPVEELMKGVVAGRQAQPLSQREVFDVGQTLVSSNLPDDAVKWFVAGLNNNNSPLVNRQNFYHALVRTHTMVGPMSRSLVKSFLIALSETQVITALLCAAVEAYDKGF